MGAAPQGSARSTAESDTADGIWVVGVDGSASSRHAALWAARHAEGRTDEIHLTAAWHAPAMASMPPLGGLSVATTDAFEQSSSAPVERLAAELRPSVDARIETIMMRGGAAASLLDAAGHASLLIVGSRGRGGFSRLALGSTSSQCATHAEIPTVVIPLGAPITSTDRIVVAIDGSVNSVAALRWALDFAAPGTAIECAMVWDISPLVAGDERFPFPEATGLARERFTHLVARHADTSEHADLVVTQRFEEGSPRHILRSMAESSDLLVMGARGHGAVSSILLGSVSSWLIHHAERPMVVVPDTEPT